MSIEQKTTPGPQSSTARPGSGVPLITDLVIAGSSAVCAFVTWLVLVPWGGVDLTVAGSTGDIQRIGPVAVVIAALVAGLAGVGSLRLLERWTSRPLTIWTVAAAVILILSLLGPLGATSAAAAGSLLALHGVVAAPLIVAVHRSRRACRALDRR